MVAEPNPDWGIGYAVPTREQIDHWEHIKYQLSPIGNGLFLSGFPDNRLLQEAIVDRGIRVMISCTHKEPPELPGVTTFRFPFDDSAHALPDPRQVDAAVDAVSYALSNNQSVLIHCMYGLNRSSYLAAQVLAKKFPKISGEDILTHIRFARPGSLHNALFADAVSKLNPSVI